MRCIKKNYGIVEKTGLSEVKYPKNREEYTYNQVIEQMENDEMLRKFKNRIDKLKETRNMDVCKEFIKEEIEDSVPTGKELKTQYFGLFCEKKSYGEYKKFVEKDFKVILQKLLDNAFKILTEKEAYDNFIDFDNNKSEFKINDIFVDESVYLELLKDVMENGYNKIYKNFYIQNVEKMKERYTSICQEKDSKKLPEISADKPTFSDEEKKKLEAMFKGYNDEEHEEFIKGLNEENLQNLLLLTNSKARNIPENNIEMGELMTAGDLISPKKEIQKNIINDLAESLKNIQGRKNKATLMYHIINQLHLFDDGNGRTSRAIFEMFSNEKFDFFNNDSFIHNEKNKYSSSNNYNFENTNSIIGAQDMGSIASFFLYKSLLENGLINNIKTKNIYTNECIKGGNTISDNSINVNDDVDVKDLDYINRALCDNNERYSVAGLTMLIMDKLKGYKEDEKEYNLYEYRIDVSMNSTESGERFSNWSANDYSMAVKIADILKKDMLELMIDIFEHPENFKYDGNINICDLVTNYNGDNEFYETFEELFNKGQANLEGTRTSKNIQKLMQIINKEDRQGIIDVQSLGKQTINELSDAVLEDETEKQEQMDLEQMKSKEK